MIVVTAMLIFVTLIFAPIHFSVDAYAYLQRLSASFNINLGWLRVFDESVVLSGKTLRCDGTISTDVDLTTIDKQGGIDLLNCITVDRLSISLRNNILTVSTWFIAIQNAVMALFTATACNLFHCQFYSQVVGTLDESCIRLQVKASTSVAELSICLIKQGVRQWKTRKSKKS